ncbi:hypothetical protein FB550_101444 [Neobacillus bataviensis]|uniref:Methionine aminopeptidase n=3 Tax=Bacillales TaxID=1385 RepID=A0A561DYI5_9BACI|nr:hypothetical protein FB550_101444 [Neobacillus bataviensis]
MIYINNLVKFPFLIRKHASINIPFFPHTMKNDEVKKMGLLNSFNQWKEARYQNHVSTMKEQGKCPDCEGRGYTVYPYNEFAYFNSFECPGCQGSGHYADWEEMR